MLRYIDYPLGIATHDRCGRHSPETSFGWEGTLHTPHMDPMSYLSEQRAVHALSWNKSLQWVNICLVFIQLCDGTSPEERQKWSLKPAKEFHYLNQSSCYELKRVDNAKEFQVSMLGFCF